MMFKLVPVKARTDFTDVLFENDEDTSWLATFNFLSGKIVFNNIAFKLSPKHEEFFEYVLTHETIHGILARDDMCNTYLFDNIDRVWSHNPQYHISNRKVSE